MSTWDLSKTKHHILICNGGSCMNKGGEEVTQAIREEITALKLDPYIHTTRTRCNGRCKDACVVIVYPQGRWYKSMTPEIGKLLVQDMSHQKSVLDLYISLTYHNEHFVTSNSSHRGVSKKNKK